MTADRSHEASWSQFWNTGSVTAFPGKKDNYDAEFLTFWRAVLDVRVERLIDLGCGNGALTWIADEILNKQQSVTKICGIDLATIDPFKALNKKEEEHPNVSFVGDCSIEAMPFKTNSIDLAISQYGIEYSNTERVLPELGRVLKPSAKLAFVLHDADSSIIRSMEAVAKGIDYLLEPGGYFDALLRLDKCQNRRKTMQRLRGDPQYQSTIRTLSQINRSIDRLQSSPVKRYLVQQVSGTNRLFAKGKPLKSEKRRDEIKQSRKLLEGTKKRFTELKQAALSGEKYQTLIKQVEQEGFTVVKQGNIFYKGDQHTTSNLGLILVATRGG